MFGPWGALEFGLVPRGLFFISTQVERRWRVVYIEGPNGVKKFELVQLLLG
jgi:hypothetical protein